jgi:outer membrane murein-binding lipoprotein Lpp
MLGHVIPVHFWRGATLTALLTCGLLLSGCIFDRKDPVPQFAVTVTPDLNLYLFDGQPMAFDQLQAELKSVADKFRASGTGNARAYVKIITQPGASYDRSLELIDYCASVGLDKIETVGR